MAISVNSVTLIGNVGSDPEKKGSGDGFATFSLATSRSWKDRDTGERREKTEWHKIVVFNKAAAKFALDYVKKGDRVYIKGALETRKWTNSEGVDIYITEVVVNPFEGELQSESKGDRRGGDDRREDDRHERSTSNRGTGSDRNSGSAYGSGYGGGGSFSDMDDDIPFAPEFR